MGYQNWYGPWSGVDPCYGFRSSIICGTGKTPKPTWKFWEILGLPQKLIWKSWIRLQNPRENPRFTIPKTKLPIWVPHKKILGPPLAVVKQNPMDSSSTVLWQVSSNPTSPEPLTQLRITTDITACRRMDDQFNHTHFYFCT